VLQIDLEKKSDKDKYKSKAKERERKERVDSPQHIFVLHRGTFQYYSKGSKTLE